ncbi:MAG: UvrD-helicase domain-containing protein [Deltaproteobacteria bacterium]|nr:UvrD-helicase domain-containing protein [Deltaproteobacteria bacterium]
MPANDPSFSLTNLSSQLNQAQYEAVVTLDGPILVAAGAGSGKTRTLVYRVAHLVHLGIPPESILLLTFTRKSASEMLSRAQILVGESCTRVAGGTFHSLAHILLRQYAPRLGYPFNFSIMDRGDMEDILGHLRKNIQSKDKNRRFPQSGTLATIISKAANKSQDLMTLIAREYIHLAEFAEAIQTVAGQYASYKKENALFDFDDLLISLARLLKEDSDARREIASNYQYIMVDEYQDTNPVQAEIVHLLGRDHTNVMVVGDDAQSIYSFRGATFQNIMQFPALFPGTKVIRLEENYRSRQPILNLTNHIIARAKEKYDKKLFSRLEGGPKPTMAVLPSSKAQSLFVCQEIKDLMAKGLKPGRMAVLFRAASHSFDLEVELMRHDIEYVKYGGRKFLESAHIKDMLSLLRVVANPGDAISLTRILLMLDGVGPKAAAQIVEWVGGQREALLTLDRFQGREAVKTALRPLATLMKDMAPAGVGLHERVDMAWAYYRPLMENKYDDHPTRMIDLKEFLRLSTEYTSMISFLADMALEPPNAFSPKGQAAQEADVLTLSTVHSAKGLEWEAVFVIWATEGRFPAFYAQNNPEDLEEERRLMYVATTRAKEQLYLICPLEIDENRYSAGFPQISRFLGDVPPRLLTNPSDRISHQAEEHSDQEKPRAQAAKTKKPSAPVVTDGLTAGDKVIHPVFGRGRVLSLLSGRKIRVDFDHYGDKTLHLDYAGLKKADPA